MDDLKLLYVQADLIWQNAKRNRQVFEEVILKEAPGNHLVVLPETFTTGFPVDPLPFAEPVDGETIPWMARMAAQSGAVICGSLLLKEGDNFTNSLIWMSPDGQFQRYDKRHVFSMGGEDEKIKPGKEALIVECNGWKIKPMVCYDLRFPVWSKNRYQDGKFEYDLAVYVANWPEVRAYPWKVLLKARAIENQCYVLGVNRVGKDGLNNYYGGHSQLIDAKGSIVSEAADGKTAVIKQVISKEALIRFREKFDVGRDWDHFTLRND